MARSCSWCGYPIDGAPVAGEFCSAVCVDEFEDDIAEEADEFEDDDDLDDEDDDDE